MKRHMLSGFFLLVLLALPMAVFAYSEEEMETLRLFYGDSDLVTSSTRSAKPVSHVAENMTVITAEEIEAMNAHTILDVLAGIPGIQMERRSPGAINASIMILGSHFRHVRVMIDGVTLNNYTDNFPDLSMIPVQVVERIEVVLGPASSAWGSALGGVVNIITKQPSESPIEGAASGSIGEKTTADLRGEISGSISRFGYYLSGTELRSEGLLPTSSVQTAGTYGKLAWKDDLSLTQMTAGHFHGRQGVRTISEQALLDAFGFPLPGGLTEERPEGKILFTTVTHRRAVTDALSVEATFRTLEQKSVSIARATIDGTPLFFSKGSELTLGGSLLAVWRDELNSVTAGVDFDYLQNNLELPGVATAIRKWGFFASDTIAAGSFSFTPSLRYDYTSIEKRLLSPSLGITWSPVSATVFRAYAGKGFSLPIALETLRSERVFSIQAGVEQGIPGWLWAKVNFFRNDVSNVIQGLVNEGRRRKQGVQAEIRSVPFFDTSLSAGYVFIDDFDRDSGKVTPSSPRYTVDLGIHYARHLFRGSLGGHYIWWVPDPDMYRPDYHNFVWDLNLSHKVSLGDVNGEIFFSGHNLFNGSQYTLDFDRNPGRWFEGGLRLKF